MTDIFANVRTPAPIPLCQCGCGQPVASRARKFITGHKPLKAKPLCQCGCGQQVAHPDRKWVTGHKPPVKRWPFAPLEQILLARLGVPVDISAPSTNKKHHLHKQNKDALQYVAMGCGATATNVANYLGMTRDNVTAYREKGLTEAAAERAAEALGRHPTEFWPDWYADVGYDLTDDIAS